MGLDNVAVNRFINGNNEYYKTFNEEFPSFSSTNTGIILIKGNELKLEMKD